MTAAWLHLQRWLFPNQYVRIRISYPAVLNLFWVLSLTHKTLMLNLYAKGLLPGLTDYSYVCII